MADEPTVIRHPRRGKAHRPVRQYDAIRGVIESSACHFGYALTERAPLSSVPTREVIARWLAGEVTTDLVETYLGDADSLLAALAAAGWELHQAGEVVPTSDVLGLAQQWETDTTETWFQPEASEYAESLRALTQQEPR